MRIFLFGISFSFFCSFFFFCGLELQIWKGVIYVQRPKFENFPLIVLILRILRISNNNRWLYKIHGYQISLFSSIQILI